MEVLPSKASGSRERSPAGQIGIHAGPSKLLRGVDFADLQVTVMSKHSDPRFGETTYQLTGIQRAEPDHSLFEIPPATQSRVCPVRWIPCGTC